MSVATAQAALYAKYNTDIASLTADSLQYLQAQEAIERWYAAATAQASREASMIQSYTIAGRSISYAQFSDGRAVVEGLKRELEALLYCRGSGLVDCRKSTESGGPGSV